MVVTDSMVGMIALLASCSARKVGRLRLVWPPMSMTEPHSGTVPLGLYPLIHPGRQNMFCVMMPRSRIINSK